MELLIVFAKDCETIAEYTHWLNWLPDWSLIPDIYDEFPDAYSVLMPFAYSYLEELIRSMTSEYGMYPPSDGKGKKRHRKTGCALVKLAQAENANKNELIALLDKANCYFYDASPEDRGENRNSVQHGFMHPRYWKKESFEGLIHLIAQLSPYAGF